VATTSTLSQRSQGRTEVSIIRWCSRLIALWHLTSLDAPTVAVTWTLAFGWVADIRLPLWVSTVLALAAWTVYIADRLLDARSSTSPLRQRHLFHWKHRRIFAPLAVAATTIAGVLILHSMPEAARARNSVLAAAALVYFASVHGPWRLPRPANSLRVRWGMPFRIPKELLVGVLFTLACATPTWTRVPGHRLELVAPILCFIALAWLNCHAIESWESQNSSPRPRELSLFHLAVSLAGITLLAAAAALMLHLFRASAMLVAASVSSALLACLDRTQHRLTPIALRALADLVLLTPLMLLAGWR